ncbi:metallophosphoesterase [Acetivibrio mesophilus]|uniref:Serine/threonine protein phosphatase n=1 Tax=Acetivibrio mesophilus TaxID=2487273 RepID=A0A4Q0I5B8_9FIRM|nr:metallophosphoesterase [Acetivibrio mesophilus]ODM27529.1 serine/threonine protein phosphatase [Clostridium sp. Bc-iso-3]RXE59488.1 serine/threonine protein phosphatase [Acetivibrio mesophilus]HHV30281.1 serine/threonine protein phosphatase [Clostridium sp.]
MAVFAISDLHLAYGIDKPMDIFGDRWSNYMQRIKDNWERTVGVDDYVIVPGDISWATYLEQAVEDFKFIEALPGRKIISKGNHDYWWTTMSKLQKFLLEHDFKTISFMHNNSLRVDEFVICGTRGWKCPGDDEFGAEDRKIYDRELNRLDLSLKSALDLSEGGSIIVAMHYPPFNPTGDPSDFVEIMRKYNVKMCIYGHLHGNSFKGAVTGLVEDIEFKLVSADYLNFEPLRLSL